MATNYTITKVRLQIEQSQCTSVQVQQHCDLRGIWEDQASKLDLLVTMLGNVPFSLLSSAKNRDLGCLAIVEEPSNLHVTRCVLLVLHKRNQQLS